MTMKLPFYLRLTSLMLLISGLLSGISMAQRNSMQDRVNQVLDILRTAETCQAAETAIDLGMEILYGGLRPVRSKDLLEETTRIDQEISRNELQFAEVLGQYAVQGPCVEQRGRALDLKLFIEELNEVAEAVGMVTAGCGLDDNLNEDPCDQLLPILNEETGHLFPAAGEMEPTRPPGREGEEAEEEKIRRPRPGFRPLVIRPSFSVKLRGPFIPPWGWGWHEDVFLTESLAPGECAVVLKETKGLMIRLHFDRIIIVTDPWVTVFGRPRGTKVPIWRLEFIPAEYVKEWNICNRTFSRIDKSVTQKVKQDHALNFFWRYYPSESKKQKY